LPSDFGKLTKVSNGVNYFNGYSVVPDPSFSQVSSCGASTTAWNGLGAGYNLTAIKDPNGNIVLTNPQPGTKGNLQQSTVRAPSAIYFDMNLVKRVQIKESKQLEIRLDAVNILNHPNFAAPTSSIDSTNFGRITALRTELVGNGMRSFIINTRLNF
jgi:hypothetical protein